MDIGLSKTLNSHQGPLVIQKVQQLGKQMGVVRLQFSQKWLSTFQKQHGLKPFTLHRKSKSAAKLTGIKLPEWQSELAQ